MVSLAGFAQGGLIKASFLYFLNTFFLVCSCLWFILVYLNICMLYKWLIFVCLFINFYFVAVLM